MPAESLQVRPSIFTTLQSLGEIILLEEKTSSFDEGLMHLYYSTPTHRDFFYPSAAESLEMIHAVVERNRQRDRERIGALEREVAELRDAVGLDRPAPRKASKTQVKKEIRAHFAQHDGQVIYPSGIAEDLNLDYDSVLAAINELEKEGKVSKA